jgi:hypothetical protein
VTPTILSQKATQSAIFGADLESREREEAERGRERKERREGRVKRK